MFGFNKCFVIVRSSDVNKVSKILSIVFYSDLRVSLHAMPTLFLSTACCLSCKLYNLIVITLLSVYNADSFHLDIYFIAYNRSFFLHLNTKMIVFDRRYLGHIVAFISRLIIQPCELNEIKQMYTVWYMAEKCVDLSNNLD